LHLLPLSPREHILQPPFLCHEPICTLHAISSWSHHSPSVPLSSLALCAGKSVLLLPVGRGDDGQHSTNEKLDVSNYMKGIKLLAAYLHEVA
jgi:hypothetical protein